MVSFSHCNECQMIGGIFYCHSSVLVFCRYDTRLILMLCCDKHLSHRMSLPTYDCHYRMSLSKTSALRHKGALSCPPGGPVPVSAGSSAAGAIPGGAPGLNMWVHALYFASALFFPRDTRVTGGRTCGTWLTIKCSADHPPLNCCLDQCSSISSVLFITPVFFPLASGTEKKMRDKGNLFRYHWWERRKDNGCS